MGDKGKIETPKFLILAENSEGNYVPVKLTDLTGASFPEEINAVITDPVELAEGNNDIGNVYIKNVGLTPILTDITNEVEIDSSTPINVNVPPMVVKESFDESDLSEGIYTVSATLDVNMGFGIVNNSTENSLTFTIGTIAIPVPASKSFYGIFVKDTTIAVAGTTPDFDAFIEG